HRPRRCPSGPPRLHEVEGRHGGKARAERLLARAARRRGPYLVEPHGLARCDERETAPPHPPDPSASNGDLGDCRREPTRRGGRRTQTVTRVAPGPGLDLRCPCTPRCLRGFRSGGDGPRRGKHPSHHPSCTPPPPS